MYLDEQYEMYRIAYNLVHEEDYDVVHINENEEELWLTKYENRTSTVIRLLHSGFDWKNHLKKDIAHVFQKTKAIKQLLTGKTIDIYNVYISSHTPVDEWEDLKRPLQLNEKNPPKMKVYYLSESNFNDELSRLQKDLDVSGIDRIEKKSEVEIEETIRDYKIYLADMLDNKNKEIENVFSFGKPILTYLLMVINVLMFIILETQGGSTNIETLIQLGAKYNPAIIDGEWWRIISSMFLHIGLLHLIMNMLALYYLGTVVERMYGSWRFLVIYFLAGIGGGLTSFALSLSVSAGASGAIFGLFGALMFFGVVHKKIFFQTMGKNLVTIVVINIVIGFTVPQIDMSAHLGGLIAGFLASAILHLPKNKKLSIQFIALIVYIAMMFGLTTYGIQSSPNSASYHLVKIEELLKAKDYEAVIKQTTDTLENPGGLEAELLFQRSIAYIELNKVDLAIQDLENSVEVKKEFQEAYFNLAILYASIGESENAIKSVSKAYELMPEDEDFIKLYEEITGENID